MHRPPEGSEEPERAASEASSDVANAGETADKVGNGSGASGRASRGMRGVATGKQAAGPGDALPVKQLGIVGTRTDGSPVSRKFARRA
ncbi:hypothetical protein Pla86_37430 [Planctomycetes bacterium Pla86]|uniref:Uncharacterized protein n=1 Tax=Engelhardtia mirabilis TaxID=2528011 RepID=A0A518BNT1_9BACT|nr:hypothetical protein Pla133_37440 [Planctomycetes bacterium Pla133]QDV02969.1 hypothetical protein Pla86_37430 [Planctomycetes bacterium Pla86]